MLEDILIWKKKADLHPKLTQELVNMNDEQLNDAFYTNIAFGTAGMRGLLGAGTNRINYYTVRKATVGYAQALKKWGKANKGVAISYDNRHLSRDFAFDCANLLATYDIPTYVYEALRPTPMLSFAVRYHNCAGGIMITASHNPKEYNGYKLYDDTGCQLIPDLANEVVDLVNAVKDPLSIVVNPSEQQKELIHILGKEMDDAYLKEVLDIQLNKDLDKSNISIAFSPEHGTANGIVQRMYDMTGYRYYDVKEQCTPDPDFSATESPNPEEAKAYAKVLELANDKQCDVVLVCDPDADRMGVAALSNGEYQLLSGNQSGAVLIEYIFSQLKEKGLMPENPVMFNTVVTSDLGEAIASYYGVETEKTLTGFKYIGSKIHHYEQTHEKNYVFGYEESYGSLIRPFVRDKDSPQACLMLAEAACYYKHHGKTLVDVLNELYQRFGTYLETQLSISLPGESGAKKLAAMMKDLRDNPLTEIGGLKVVKRWDFKTREIEENGNILPLEGFDISDVLKYQLEDGSWIAVRPSGTEPKCKVYFCIKAVDLATCHNKLDCMQANMKAIMLKD